MPDVTVITHARDAAAGLAKLLPTVQWAAERIVVDMQSGDDTADVARAFGARVVSVEPHPRVDGIRNRFLGEAATEWIFVLDADEYLAHDAPELVARLIEEHGSACDAFAIPRLNRIGEHVMRGSGWYPDHQIRLFRRHCVCWADDTHQAPRVLSGASRLRVLVPPDCLHIHHDNYPNVRAFLERQLRYALQDRYDPDPAAFHIESYVARAYAEFARRHDPANDGDLSRALATAMAWDQLVRGLIHWDQLDPKPSLENLFALPVATVAQNPGASRELSEARERIAALEEHQRALLNTRVMRFCRRLDRIVPAWLRRLAAGRRLE